MSNLLFSCTQLQLKSAKDEADAFTSQRQQLEATKTQFALWRLWHLDARVRQEEQALDAVRTALGQASAEEGEVAGQLEEISRNLAKS